jgi:hypothetical protein
VPVYKAKINAKGLDSRKWCGRNRNVDKESRNESPSVCLPEAFSMMALSIAVMTGATRTPAVAAEATSAPRRRPRLCVFQRDVLGVVVVVVVVGGLIISGLRFGRGAPGPAAVLIASQRSACCGKVDVAVVLHVTVKEQSSSVFVLFLLLSFGLLPVVVVQMRDCILLSVRKVVA